MRQLFKLAASFSRQMQVTTVLDDTLMVDVFTSFYSSIQSIAMLLSLNPNISSECLECLARLVLNPW